MDYEDVKRNQLYAMSIALENMKKRSIKMKRLAVTERRTDVISLMDQIEHNILQALDLISLMQGDFEETLTQTLLAFQNSINTEQLRLNIIKSKAVESSDFENTACLKAIGDQLSLIGNKLSL